jgi:hypothetical protein
MASGIIYNHIPQTIEKLHQARSKIIRKTVLDVEAGAKLSAPVKTGLLKSSIYGITADYSGYRALGALAGQALFPEVAKPAEGRGLVVVGARYAIFVELGTIHMSASPFLTPAALNVLPNYIKAWVAIEGMLQ